ncbi:MAG: hypothetical protein OEY89_13475 [Gammaproteobacteria bacterium]|nr:hypothetical protein [Gammaproteobacteria bacterium]
MLTFKEHEGDDTIGFFDKYGECGYLSKNSELRWVIECLHDDSELTQEEAQQISDKLAELNALEAARMVII